MARKGLKEDHPEAYKVLDNFHWTQKDMESVMLAINEGKDPSQAAKDWIKDIKKKLMGGKNNHNYKIAGRIDQQFFC